MRFHINTTTNNYYNLGLCTDLHISWQLFSPVELKAELNKSYFILETKYKIKHMKCYLDGVEQLSEYYLNNKLVSYEEFVNHIDSEFLIKQNLLNDVKKLKGLNS